jgi:hypothetical protein
VEIKTILLAGILLLSTKTGIASQRSTVAAGLSIGTGLPWIFHLKPELIVRPLNSNPSFSAFVELNSVILVTEVSYGFSLNYENTSGYMNSIYVGSGDDIFPNWSVEDREEWRKQFMLGWEFKKEYGYNLGYFLNAGINIILGPVKVFPKVNLGFFYLPGF